MTSKLMFACRTCQFSEEAQSSCVFRNNMYNTVGETAGVTQDVGSDPTVGCCCLSVSDSDCGIGLKEQALLLPMCCFCGCEIGDGGEDEGFENEEDGVMDLEDEESSEVSPGEKQTNVKGRDFNLAWMVQMEEEEQDGAAGEDDDEGFESGGDGGGGAQMTARVPHESTLTD